MNNPTVFQAPPTATPQSESSSNSSDVLASDFAELQKSLNAEIGLAFSPVGRGKTPTPLGDWQTGTAWSTIKVPLAIAAYREDPQVTDAMRAAITQSDNAAAESVWQTLGEPTVAAQKVEQVLRDTGDADTTVQSQRVRPEFTAFGQTNWSLTDQAQFLAVAWCDNQNAEIFALMGQVASDQHWGIGSIPGSKFKGGWGPSTSGSYLVRQIGILQTQTGMVAVAMAAQPASGSFSDGTQALNEVANWLQAHIAELPANQCGV